MIKVDTFTYDIVQFTLAYEIQEKKTQVDLALPMTINKFFQYRFQINNQVFGFAHKL
jgi:hypothetical protein